MPGEPQHGLGQRIQPLFVDPVGVHVVSPAQGLIHGGLQPGDNVLMRQLFRPPALIQPLGDQGVGLVDPIGADQGAEILLVRRGAFGIPLDPLGEVLGQIRITSLVAQQLRIRAAERILFMPTPFRLLGDRAVEPGVGGRVLARVGQGLGVLLLETVVAGILLGQLLLQPQRGVGLPRVAKVVHPLLRPALHRPQVLRLPPVDRFERIQQGQHFVGLQDPRRLPAKVLGQEILLGVGRLCLRYLTRFFENPLLQLFPPAAVQQDHVADPSHAGLALGQLLGLFEMLRHPRPLLAAAEVQHQGQVVVESGLAGGKRPFGVHELHQRLVEELHALAAGELPFDLPVEGVGIKRLELLRGLGRPPAVLVGGLDPRSPPGAGELDELIEPGGRGQLAVAIVFHREDRVPLGVNQHVNLVVGVVGVFQHQQRLPLVLGFQLDRVIPIGVIQSAHGVAV